VKCAPAPLSDAVRVNKKSSTPITSDRTTDKVGADKNIKTSNKNLAQDKFTETDVVHTTTSYFDPVWNVFSHHTGRSIQWIPKQIVGIGCRNVNLI
jgi:hypothetical protein